MRNLPGAVICGAVEGSLWTFVFSLLSSLDLLPPLNVSKSPSGRRDSGRLGQRDHKEERPRKESKCRTLFVRNVSVR